MVPRVVFLKCTHLGRVTMVITTISHFILLIFYRKLRFLCTNYFILQWKLFVPHFFKEQTAAPLLKLKTVSSPMRQTSVKLKGCDLTSKSCRSCFI